MKGFLNLFNSFVVSEKDSSICFDYANEGILVTKDIINEYSKENIDNRINLYIKSKDIFKTFFESWEKVDRTSLINLRIEQAIHYFTTYGFESLGIKSDFIYIPKKENVPQSFDCQFLVIKGMTNEEVAERARSLIYTNIALKEEDIKKLFELVRKIDIKLDLSKFKNKEFEVIYRSELNIPPSIPEEYIRYWIFRYTGKSIVIKNEETFDAIRNSEVKGFLLDNYPSNIASVFYRYKMLFLAFKDKSNSKIINKIRKKAVKEHIPFVKDLMSTFIDRIKKNQTFSLESFNKQLISAPVFRKALLLEALNFHLFGFEPKGISYRIRNGKLFSKKYDREELNSFSFANEVKSLIYNSILNDLSHLKEKKFFLDCDLKVPTSGKSFGGNIPFGTKFTYSEDQYISVGVHWKNVLGERVDLDFSLISAQEKVGWDSSFKNDELVFSGDMTNAISGATESFLIKNSKEEKTYVMFLNFYNKEQSLEVPYTFFINAQDELIDNKKKLPKVDFMNESSISGKNPYKIIGFVKIDKNGKHVYITEGDFGVSRTSLGSEKSINLINFLKKKMDSQLSLRELLIDLGAIIVEKEEEADYNFKTNSFAKDQLISIFEKPLQ